MELYLKELYVFRLHDSSSKFDSMLPAKSPPMRSSEGGPMSFCLYARPSRWMRGMSHNVNPRLSLGHTIVVMNSLLMFTAVNLYSLNVHQILVVESNG